MGDIISKEAWTEARKLLDGNHEAIAAAIQKHMDATAEVEQRLNHTWEQHDDKRLMEMRALEKRAEEAEAKLAILKSVNRYQRGYSDGQREERQRLTDLVSEVREWNDASYQPTLERILSKYEK